MIHSKITIQKNTMSSHASLLSATAILSLQKRNALPEIVKQKRSLRHFL